MSPGYPNKTLRALGEAHDALVAQRYLREVRVTGTRSEPVLTYVFADRDEPDPALVRLLREHKVSAAMATKLAREESGRVEEALAFVDHQRRAGAKVRSDAAVIVDYLTKPDKYEWDPAEAAAQQSGAMAAERARQRQLELNRMAEAEEETKRVTEALFRASPAEQWAAERVTLQLMLLRKTLLTQAEWERLEAMCCSGELSAVQLKRDLVQAGHRFALQGAVEDLRARLA